MSDDLDRYIAEQCANDPEFKRAYELDGELVGRARKIAKRLRPWWGRKGPKWYTILAVLVADRELDSPSP